MHSPRWRKILRDLWQHKGKSVAVILSIAISTLAVGLILTSYSIIEREMNAGFLGANPHACSFRLDPFQEELLERVKQFPSVGSVEARRIISGQINRGDNDWIPMFLYVLRDYNEMTLDIVEPETGSWPPAEGEILLERQALSVLGGKLGETVAVKTEQGHEAELVLSGLAYDVVLPQAAMERIVYAYVSSETLEIMGEIPYFNQLSVDLSENNYDLEHVKKTAGDLEAWIENQGYRVFSTDIPVPGKHPHDQIMSGMFVIQEIFGILCCLLCCILLINVVSVILSGQLPQIGVMKALGAKTRQIVAVYFSGILFLGLAGLLLSFPFAILLGRFFSKRLAVMMNINIVNEAPSPWTYLLILCIGLGIPLIAAYLPILKAGRISIQDALNERGIRQTVFRRGLSSRMLRRVPFLSRPMLIALRNTFRKRGRLFLTTAVLSAAAALYMSAVNIGATIDGFINDLQQANAWGLRLNLGKPYAVDGVTNLLSEVEGVGGVEAFWYVQADIVDGVGKKQLSSPLICVERSSKMLKNPYLEGRWLTGRSGEIVVNQYLANRISDLKIGDELRLRINDVLKSYQIAGIIKSPGGQMVFMNFDEYVSLSGLKGIANGFYIMGESREKDYLRQLKQEVEKKLETGDFDVIDFATAWDGFEALNAHFDMVFVLILVVTLSLILVGGNGIILGMKTNILERTREIGVMKAIGSSETLLYKIFIGEGIVIGLLSWLLAVVLTIPVSYLIADSFGRELIRSSLPAAFSMSGFLIGLIGTVTVTALSCFFPARSVAGLSVREALLYE